MGLVVDHVIVCVPDLVRSVRSFERRHGVSSVPGGRHDGHGTANRLIPLGDAYIELVAVVDPDEARESGFGSWVTSRTNTDGADAIALRTDELDVVCRRLDLEPLAMSRRTAVGQVLRWRIAGMDHLVAKGLPFFIEWDVDPSLHPGRANASHAAGDLVLGQVIVSGDEPRLRLWTEGVPGLAVEAGEPGVRFELVEKAGL
ncbi:MAG TPA: VOC family protein [Acidimicrobiia bacterium]|nr:VOC family protein [Acidimicrobiia bacterium]